MEACTFGGDVIHAPRCIKVADPDGFCPRHRFMVEQMGKENAERVELGVQCWGCSEYVDEEDAVFHERLQQHVCHECEELGEID